MVSGVIAHMCATFGATPPVFIRRLAEAVAGEAFEDPPRGERLNRADLLPVVEHRCRAPVFNAGHLARKLVDVGRRVARHEKLDLVPVPGQRNVARRRAPVFRVIEIGLVEGAALPSVNRAGVAVAELIELAASKLIVLGCLPSSFTAICVPSIASMVPAAPLTMPAGLSVPVN